MIWASFECLRDVFVRQAKLSSATVGASVLNRAGNLWKRKVTTYLPTYGFVGSVTSRSDGQGSKKRNLTNPFTAFVPLNAHSHSIKLWRKQAFTLSGLGITSMRWMLWGNLKREGCIVIQFQFLSPWGRIIKGLAAPLFFFLPSLYIQVDLFLYCLILVSLSLQIHHFT